MTRARVHALVQSITYKKGWSFRVNAMVPGLHYPTGVGDDLMRFTIFATVPDARADSQWAPEVPIQMSRTLLSYDLASMEEGQFIEMVYQWVLEFERHEAGEFFCVGGARPFDPHGGGA